MPGITGFISRHPKAKVQTMVECMATEPFYSSGSYVDEASELHIGWVAHKDSFADCLPIWNENRDVCLFFAGESFSEHKRATQLVHAYEDFGIGFIEKLNGWFSGMLLDRRKGEIVLFNDRYGFGRVYYHEDENGFYFSSEAKALLKVLPKLRKLDPAGLGEFFSCGCALQNRSLFAGVQCLPGGSRWTFRRGEPAKKESYFRPESWESLPTLSGDEFYEKLKDTFARVLPRYLRNSTGVSLTGGLDSRMIMAWAQRPAGSLPCYTFGGSYRDCADVTVARRVAQICRQPHQVIPVGKEFIADFPRLAEKTVYVTDGAMDVSGSPDLFANRIARGIAPVRLTGNYGGEILRGIVAFKPTRVQTELFDAAFSPRVKQAEETYASEAKCRRLSFVAFKQVPWHHHCRASVEQSQLTLRAPYLDNDLVSLVYQAPAELSTSSEPSLRLIADGNPALARLGTDRAGTMQEFLVKAEYAYDYGMPNWLAQVDSVLRPLHLEKLFLGRHKFYHFRYWYRHQLASYLKDILLDSRTLGRPYLNPLRVRAIVEGHTSGRSNHTMELHRVLSSELIQRTLIEA